MRKVRLDILALSSTQSMIETYIVILGDLESNKKLPIIVKPNEAQYILFKIDNKKPPRPFIYNVFRKLLESFNITINEVFIHTYKDGIFYTKLVLSNINGNVIEIDCSSGDGISIALECGCPIYINEDILNDDNIIDFDDDRKNKPRNKRKRKRKTIEERIKELELILNEALKKEEYEIAAEIRDKLKKLKEKQK